MGARVPDDDELRICTYCGAEHPRFIGHCKVCGVRVCDRCGNFQHSMGQRFAAHDGCIRRDDTQFSMIKFVK
jgi:predicted ATP-dependent serine protease